MEPGGAGYASQYYIIMEDREHPWWSNERVKINVGGTVFETTRSTLTNVDNTMFSAMVANRWRREEEFFIDRDATYFAKILNYLRDGENFSAPIDADARESLRREAEFYNLPGLAKKCYRAFRIGDRVRWKDEAVEMYSRFLLRLYPWHTDYEAKCICCGSTVLGNAGPQTVDEMLYGINEFPLEKKDDWTVYFTEHFVPSMEGTVTEVVDYCCRVKWTDLWDTHVPQAALQLASSG